MKDIFANLYNKVTKFFHQAEESTDTSAKDVACNRLKLVLMQDRTNLSPAIMDRMKHELIDLLSKYVELDKELLDLSFEQEDSQMALMLSIPVIRAKEESEIEELLKLEEEVSEGVSEEIDSDEEIDDDETTEDDNEEEDSEDSEDSEVVEETTTESENITEDDSKDKIEEKTEPEENVEEEKKPEPSKKKSSKGAQV